MDKSSLTSVQNHIGRANLGSLANIGSLFRKNSSKNLLDQKSGMVGAKRGLEGTDGFDQGDGSVKRLKTISNMLDLLICINKMNEN